MNIILVNAGIGSGKSTFFANNQVGVDYSQQGLDDRILVDKLEQPDEYGWFINGRTMFLHWDVRGLGSSLKYIDTNHVITINVTRYESICAKLKNDELLTMIVRLVIVGHLPHDAVVKDMSVVNSNFLSLSDQELEMQAASRGIKLSTLKALLDKYGVEHNTAREYYDIKDDGYQWQKRLMEL